ncbi:MAG: hypothetical protein ACRDJX_10360 [Solirubrobacteraceae bacterium]
MNAWLWRRREAPGLGVRQGDPPDLLLLGSRQDVRVGRRQLILLAGHGEQQAVAE